MQEVSEALIRQLFAEEAEEPAMLVTLESAELDAPIRATDHDGRISGTTRRGLRSRGEIFDFTPFNFRFGGAGEGDPIRDATFEVFVRDGEVISAVRQAMGNPTLTAEVVRISAPDVVEMAMTAAQLADVEIEPPTMRSTVRARSFSEEPACKASYNPARTPGLY